ncbi:MAG TPA: hypothetical protein VF145_05550 [Chitinophagaceae bacterium]
MKQLIASGKPQQPTLPPVNRRTNRKNGEKRRTPASYLCQGKMTKVFEAAEVIQLVAERQEFLERAGKTRPHVQYENRLKLLLHLFVFSRHCLQRYRRR